MARGNRWTYAPTATNFLPTGLAASGTQAAPAATANTFAALSMQHQPSSSASASFPQLFVAFNTVGTTPGFVELYNCTNLTCSASTALQISNKAGLAPAGDHSDTVGTASNLLGPSMSALSYLDPVSSKNHWVLAYSSSVSSASGNLWVLNQGDAVAVKADSSNGVSDFLPATAGYLSNGAEEFGVFYADTGLNDLFSMAGSIGPTGAEATGFPASPQLVEHNSSSGAAGPRLVVSTDSSGAFLSATAFYEVESSKVVFAQTSSDPTLSAANWGAATQIDANGAPLSGTAGEAEGVQGAFVFPASSALAGKWGDFYVDLNNSSGLPQLVYQQEQ
jgi:hypothetical protein